MGGTVTVGCRFSDGTQRVQHLWTNSLPYFVHDVRTLGENRTFIDEYLADAEDKSEKPLAPYGYGLVLLDFKSGVLLSSQGYTTFGRVSAIGVVRIKEELEDDPEEFLQERLRFEVLIEAGRVSRRMRRWRMERDSAVPFPSLQGDILHCSFENMIQMAYEFRESNRLSSQFYDAATGLPRQQAEFGVDLSPLRLEDMRDAPPTELRKRVVELGFELTDADQAAWDEWEREEAEEQADGS